LEDEAPLLKGQVAEMVSRRGVTVLLGRHPRANLGLAVEFAVGVARSGMRSMILDCDRTVTLEKERSGLGEASVSKIFLSHPEDTLSLARDLKAAGTIANVGCVVLNRPSSLIEASGIIQRYGEKKRLWQSTGGPLADLSDRCPVLILEDSRRIEQLEYKVHPALYYISQAILNAVEHGKDVQRYQILKRRTEAPRIA
jgi:hypothetical protein